jgi:hypothetical protein
LRGSLRGRERRGGIGLIPLNVFKMMSFHSKGFHSKELELGLTMKVFLVVRGMK